MPRGKNYVNNNKGLTMQRHKKETHMEKCFYGAGCTRPDCKYLHPSLDASSEQQRKRSNEPCMPYLAGLCTFTAQGCHKRHPPKEEIDLLIAKYRRVLCRFGETCKTNGCLYVHPGEEGADELLKIKRQAPALPRIGVNAPGFPPLLARAAASGSLGPRPPHNSAWKPSPPTKHAMAQPPMSRPAPLSVAPRPTWQGPPSTAAPRWSGAPPPSTKTLSINAKEFTPGGTF